MKFVSTHHHTTYSFLDGYGQPEQHLLRAAELGYSALAFTEHGNVSSHFRAEKAANKIGTVKPIFGIEAYHRVGTTPRAEIHCTTLTILAMNRARLSHLNLAVTRSYKRYHIT
jgi:DNA polymerase-3 subunit alpha